VNLLVTGIVRVEETMCTRHSGSNYFLINYNNGVTVYGSDVIIQGGTYTWMMSGPSTEETTIDNVVLPGISINP
jgi:hypothetical protein